MSLVEQDRARYLGARDSSFQDLLVYAAKKSGRSPIKIAHEFRKISNSPGRLNMIEYVRNGLYDIDRFTPEERQKFISNDLHWPIVAKCNGNSWYAAAEDKVIAGTLLAAGQVRVPETLAVIDAGPRLYPGLNKISTPEALQELLAAHGNARIFGKIVDGMVSFGAFRIEKSDEKYIYCSDREAMTYDQFLDDLVGKNAYLLQKELKNHSALAPYAAALATVRMVIMHAGDEVLIPASVIKLPQGNNIADAFWRPGNLACDIDPKSGRIRKVARRGIETEFLEDHPEVDGLMGLTLPFWQELREMNERAARLFAPIRYQSTDIAITDDGPVLVEINCGGGFDLPQYASGRGLLTPEVRRFFESCGVKLSPKKGLLARLLKKDKVA